MHKIPQHWSFHAEFVLLFRVHSSSSPSTRVWLGGRSEEVPGCGQATASFGATSSFIRYYCAQSLESTSVASYGSLTMPIMRLRDQRCVVRQFWHNPMRLVCAISSCRKRLALLWRSLPIITWFHGYIHTLGYLAVHRRIGSSPHVTSPVFIRDCE